MKFHKIRIRDSCFYITEGNLMVTPFILRKMNEIKNAYMNTFFQVVIRVTLFKLSCVHLTQVKQNAVCPVSKVQYLHLKVKLCSILQAHCHIKDSQLIILIFLSRGCGENRCLPDLFGILSEESGDKPLPHLTVLHQFFKAEINCGKHDKIVSYFFHMSSPFLRETETAQEKIPHLPLIVNMSSAPVKGKRVFLQYSGNSSASRDKRANCYIFCPFSRYRFSVEDHLNIGMTILPLPLRYNKQIPAARTAALM